MATKLRDLELHEISLVHKDRTPACEGAKVVLVKMLGWKEPIQKIEEDAVSEIEKIFKLEASIRSGKIQKYSVDQEEALLMVADVTKEIVKIDHSLSYEQAYAKAMNTIPRIASLAAGHPWELVAY